MITLIAAVARNGVIGQGNAIPWHLPEDFKHFREATSHHAVIMGSKTWDSLPARYRPLPDRYNLVVTRDAMRMMEGNAAGHPGTEWEININTAIATAKSRGWDEVFVIGGASLYEQTIGIADRLLISHVDLDPDGDTFFPEIGPEWYIVSERDYDKFVIRDYRRRTA